jgi:tetrahydromethanopterin S-methyltransferase subunit A
MTKEEKYINHLYPWGGDFITGDFKKNVAVLLLNIDFIPSMDIAIYGKLKTENIGIEKIIANVISNPFIRFLVICGEDIRGHRSGRSLICLHQNGIDADHRIIGAPGAIPYIENIDGEAIKRFQNQIELIDLIDVTDKQIIEDRIINALNTKTDIFGKPFIALRLVKTSERLNKDTRALHSRITMSYLGKVKKRM